MRRAHSTSRQSPRVVAVISSAIELQRATRLRRLPDLFELRLDALVAVLDDLERTISRLGAPLIITARHSSEGGLNKLRLAKRAEILSRFLPFADYVDVELGSAGQMDRLIRQARKLNVSIIISAHDFRGTPTVDVLQQMAQSARKHRADIFKLATRTDTAAEATRLIEFFDLCKYSMPISAMGMGKLGRASRAALLRRGSALQYGHLSRAAVRGQFSLAELRRQLPPARRRKDPSR